MNQDSKRPITLEDLLRLKRAERPPAQFWAQFDRELRAKQLSALVEKRPWWRTRLSFPKFSRVQWPLGATIMLAATVFVVREYRAPVNATVEVAKISGANGITSSEAFRLADDRVPATPASASVSASTEQSVVTAIPATEAVSFVADNGVGNESLITSTRVSPLVSLLGETSNSFGEATPSPRYIVASLNAVQANAPAVTRGLLNSTRGFESRAMARTPVVEPLAQMRNPADASRARFQSAMASSFLTEVPARANDRTPHRLTDDRLRDDGARRFNASGNNVGLGLGLTF